MIKIAKAVGITALCFFGFVALLVEASILNHFITKYW